MTYLYHEQSVTCWESDSVKYAQKCYWACFPAFLLQFILEGRKQHHFILNKSCTSHQKAFRRTLAGAWKTGKMMLCPGQKSSSRLWPSSNSTARPRNAAWSQSTNQDSCWTSLLTLQTSDPAYVFCNGILQLHTNTHLHKCRAHHHPQITSISLFPLSLYIYSYMLNHTVCTYVCNVQSYFMHRNSQQYILVWTYDTCTQCFQKFL